ncbi:MAG: SO2930 family diheme c-type cytochrome [Persicimonas sp.]
MKTYRIGLLLLMMTLLAAPIGCGEEVDANDDDNAGDDAGSDAVSGSDAERGTDGDAGEDPPDCELQLPPDGQPFEKLSEYCFFRGDPATHQPSEGVVAFDVSTKLYSDRSDKLRFVVLPEGETIAFDETERWEFPVGSILIKTFYYPHDARDPSLGRDLLETRLLIRGEEEWEPQIYRWNEEQTEADRFLLGQNVDVDWIDEDGEDVSTRYMIPTKSDCKSCHNHDDQIIALGPRTRQLNRDNDYGDGPVNQLAHFEQLGLFDTDLPPLDTLDKLIDPVDDSHPIDQRARTYLEGNCAHCHSPGGPARNSALYLNIEEDVPRRLGVCKPPVAAGGGTGGRPYAIYPGQPDQSIMVFRMNSNDPEIKMPELPLRTVDEFGVNLITDWIAQMEGDCSQ